VISIRSTGSFNKTESALKRMRKPDILSILQSGGREGVSALVQATPIDSGLTADSWDFVVSSDRGKYTITWTNNDVENGFPVAIMLQYGYGTGTGGYVQGRDYINPAIQPIFDSIANRVWKAVTSA
jgi:hypothetical protein